jgi:hypothetical protein
MILSAGDNYYVEVLQTNRAGSVWTVRLFKKLLFFKRRLSSDWFLDEEQAKRFGEQLGAELRNGGSPETIKARKPGWTLHQPLQ